LKNTQLFDAICSNAGEYYWDVIVIGAGMGGGTLGFELAKAGRSVLFVERGNLIDSKGALKKSDKPLSKSLEGDTNNLIDHGLWPDKFFVKTDFGCSNLNLPLGCGTGGSTLLYAAHLERLFPSDFTPKNNYPHINDSNLPESWPITFADLLPYYKKAESLFRVKGTKDLSDNYIDSNLLNPISLKKRGEYLYESFSNSGLSPYQSHIACDFLKGCSECGNKICHQNCKNDANKICIIPALTDYGARILPNCTVEKISADESNVTSITCIREGSKLKLRGSAYVLSAGSLSTPTILLKSASELWPRGLANSSGYVGKNLMFHASDFVAVSSKILNDTNEQKTISTNIFYQFNNLKLGTIQSTGILIDKYYVAMLLNKVLKKNLFLYFLLQPIILLISFFVASLFKRIALFSTIVEDLPYLENCVYVDKKNPDNISIKYRYTKDLRYRSNFIYKLFKNSLRGKHFVFKLTGINNINFGHSCGTCRFGTDPKTSVLNSENRAHDLKNLWVCDSSFFPSSGGTNPSLTVAANAIRVAEIIEKYFKKYYSNKDSFKY
jgi:choline dehydrogenase-like flavoprotein